MNQAFKNSGFWLAYEDICHEITTKTDSQIWVGELKEDFLVFSETRSYVQTAEELRDMALNGAAIDAISLEMTEDFATDQNIYDQRFKAHREQLSNTLEFALDQFQNQEHHYHINYIHLDFPLPLGYQLRLSLVFDPKEHSIGDQSLLLVDEKQERKLGYSDCVHPNPYCLRLEELDALVSYWKKESEVWKNQSEIAWVLLAKFIGITSNGERVGIQHKYEKTLEKLGIKSTEKFFYQVGNIWDKSNCGYEYICTEIPNYLKGIGHINVDKIRNLPTNSLRKHFENPEEPCFPFRAWKAIMDIVM